MWVQKTTILSHGVKLLWRPLNIKMLYLADLVPESRSAGDWENSLTNYVKVYACPALVLFPMPLPLMSITETVPGPARCELVILFTYIFIYIPRTPAYNHFPVMPPAVNEYVASYSVAPLACESLWCVTLFGGCFITFHCQVIMRHFQFSMSRFGVQFKWLT